MKRKLTCTVCPMGCSLEAEIKDGKVVSVTGNTCKRGEKYAESECINPLRSITTTVALKGGGVVAVKSREPIPKDKIFECMKIINNTKKDLPISAGDVIIKDVFGTDIIATQSKN